MQAPICIIDISYQSCVCFDCFLLEVAHKAVAECGVQKIAHEEEVKENSLHTDDEHSLEDFGLFDVQEEEQMEPFIISFF